MYWNETQKKEVFVVPDDILDVSFAINCKCLPLDNIYALSQALLAELPWLADEEHAGIHHIYGAESGNGWERPSDPDNDMLFLSRRQKMMLRLPKTRLDDARQLIGKTLDVDGYPLEVGKVTTRMLSDLSILFARYVVSEQGQSEAEFLQQAADMLSDMDIRVRKMMAGKERAINLPDQKLYTRSLMLADLEKDESVRLQQYGLGPQRKLGCGLFMPQKGIKAVNQDD